MVARRKSTEEDPFERKLISNQLYVALLRYGNMVRNMESASKCIEAIEKFNELDRQIMEMLGDDIDTGKRTR